MGIAVIAAITLGALLAGMFAFPGMYDKARSLSDSFLKQLVSDARDIPSPVELPIQPSIPTAAEPSITQPIAADNIEVKQYHTETITESVLVKRVFLDPGQKTEFAIQIPDKNVTALKGTISVQGGSYVNATFREASGALLCLYCNIQVYHENPVSIPASPGERIQLAIQNSHDDNLRILDVRLEVTYQVTVEGSAPLDPIRLEPDPQVTAVQDLSTDNSRPPALSASPELRAYALQVINDERKKAGLPPVDLSQNTAAQLHAEDLLAQRTISHWTSDGMKPYMRYTMYGGDGAVSQNVATYGRFNIEMCQTDPAGCVRIDPRESVNDLTKAMVYGDAECCDNGHRDNILDKHHTHVSIGIAYDEYLLVLVQNFENNYFDFIQTKSWDNRHVWLQGPYSYGGEGKYHVRGIGVYYDDTPSKQLYEQHKADRSYGLGEMVAIVVEPAPFGYQYPAQTFSMIEASVWNIDEDRIDVKFDLLSVTNKHGPGVYTVALYLDPGDDKSGNSQFDVVNYSLFID